MSLTRQVFRAGIEYSPRHGAWHISTGETPHDSASFEAARGAVPIVVEERGPKYRLTTLVLRSGGNFDVEVSRLLGEAADYRGGLRDWKDVTYLADIAD